MKNEIKVKVRLLQEVIATLEEGHHELCDLRAGGECDCHVKETVARVKKVLGED